MPSPAGSRGRCATGWLRRPPRARRGGGPRPAPSPPRGPPPTRARAGAVVKTLPLDLLFDGTEPGYEGRLLGTRRVGDAEGLAIEVGSEGAPKVVSVARVRVVVDRVLHEFAVPVVRRPGDPLPVLLTTYPTEVHTVERRSQVRGAPTSAARLRVA